MGKKAKVMMIAAILMLAIGFATVSTVLYINGTAKLVGNDESFSKGIIFTQAVTDDGGVALISQDGHVITYTSKNIKELDEETKLDFEISNLSKEYDATASILCKFGDDENGDPVVVNDFVSFTLDKTSYSLASGGKDTGRITIKLDAVSEVARDIDLTCEIVATAIEKTVQGTIPTTPTTSFEGVVTASDGTPLTSGYLAVFSEKKVFAIGSDGKVEITGLEPGLHEMYLMNEDPTELAQKDIVEGAIASGVLAYSATVPSFEMSQDTTKYYIKQLYDLSVVGENVTIGTPTAKITSGDETEVTITPAENYYIESVTCTNGYTTNATVGETATAEQTITITNNNFAGGSTCTVNVQPSV